MALQVPFQLKWFCDSDSMMVFEAMLRFEDLDASTVFLV